MEATFIINDETVVKTIDPDMTLQKFLRREHYYSVKCGCETSNCGACTVLLDGKPVLSCSILAARAAGHKIETLEGLQKEAEEIGAFIADEGADQCGFCNPGYIITMIALFRQDSDPSDEKIKTWLAGNFCRCTGYEGQMRGFLRYRDQRRAG
ncbi:MAG: 2Fe-2S iron-sulfur cluster binding domain-containing protein [Erysipelotrichaceae bacterium]|nr:2Fe-2S iron-sulfur cluster binding domain-containing protein [Erysipelotrichaceae bacterium]